MSLTHFNRAAERQNYVVVTRGGFFFLSDLSSNPSAATYLMGDMGDGLLNLSGTSDFPSENKADKSMGLL